MAKLNSTQKDKVAAHLKRYKYITPAIAINTYAIWRLAAVINRLRDDGVNINTYLMQDAKGHKYAKYTIVAA